MVAFNSVNLMYTVLIDTDHWYLHHIHVWCEILALCDNLKKCFINELCYVMFECKLGVNGRLSIVDLEIVSTEFLIVHRLSGRKRIQVLQ